MAGIYFHIPFCKQACTYCDFHFSTNLHNQEVVLSAMLKELKMEAEFLSEKKIESIYFGGGTPSLLDVQALQRLIDEAANLFEFTEDIEVTIEANPDDINAKKLTALRQSTINRISLGVQSFDDNVLQWMHRAHNAYEAKNAISSLQDAGIDNLSVDLIVGIPNTNANYWQQQLQIITHFNIPHISAYGLTLENKTAYHHQVKSKKIDLPTENKVAKEFMQAHQSLRTAQYNHYEISNYAKNNFSAKHNASYWQNKPYMGIGPSAHSYNGKNTRKWNLANNAKYITAIQSDKKPYALESLTKKQKLNEYFLLRLRTASGINKKHMEAAFGMEAVESMKNTFKSWNKKYYVDTTERLCLTPAGWLVSDFLIKDLFA